MKNHIEFRTIQLILFLMALIATSCRTKVSSYGVRYNYMENQSGFETTANFDFGAPRMKKLYNEKQDGDDAFLHYGIEVFLGAHPDENSSNLTMGGMFNLGATLFALQWPKRNFVGANINFGFGTRYYMGEFKETVQTSVRLMKLKDNHWGFSFEAFVGRIIDPQITFAGIGISFSRLSHISDPGCRPRPFF
ncbi:hypothetical protein KKF84_01130 [Myxococcota bacterium]|nr:hypothetical protein [Myxococcota bacterium]MBU1533886.1 hypothetical protein [Myxococcota bacterium]